MRFVTLAALLLLTSSGCYMHSLENRRWRPGEAYASDTTIHFLWGITGTTTPAPVCRHGFDRVAAYMPWWGAIVGTLTAGIVVPTTVDYVCNTPWQPDGVDRRSLEQAPPPPVDPAYPPGSPQTYPPGG